MKIHWDVQQRSDAWRRLRCGVPTASCFSQIVCSQMGKSYNCPECGERFSRRRKRCAECAAQLIEVEGVRPSSQSEAYMDFLLDDWFFLMRYGVVRPDPEQQYSSPFMDRGTELEGKARNAYSALYDFDVRQVGFVSTDNGWIGCSPDGLVMDGDKIIRGLEIKTPKGNTQIRYLRTKSVDEDYRCQIQGNLWLTGLDEWDVFAYGIGEYPSVCVTVQRDEKFIAGLQDHVLAFVEKMMHAREDLIKEYPTIIQPFAKQAAVDTLGITDEDVERIIAANESEAANAR